MIEVSELFKQAVYSPIRKAAAKVVFEVLDNTAYADAAVRTSVVAPLSRANQITNKVRMLSEKYATFERDYFRLDGSFKIPPKATDAIENELGWWSDAISDGNGVFNVPQVVTINFSEGHNSMGLTIIFDAAANEYAADFDIVVYQANGVLIVSESIIGNTETSYVWINGIDDYRKIDIVIKKWGKPFRRARVTEIDFGVFQWYEGNKLIRVNLLEQMNVVGDTLPANEIKFVIDNSSKEFNILNPQGFYRFLKERQEVSMSIGIEVENEVFEYIDITGYYLAEWKSDEGALTTTLTARNIFDLLDKEYEQRNGIINLFELATDVLAKAHVSNYFIDPSLRDIPTVGFADKVTHRKALQCIGVASKSAIHQKRNGTLNIEPFAVLDESTSYIYFAGADMFAGIATPTVYNGFDLKSISFDNVYKEPQIQLEKLVQMLVMVVYENGEKVEYSFDNVGVKEGAVLKCDNPLINSLSQAQSVAEWILSESNLRALYSVNWRQNPAIECGDIVLIEDSFQAQKQSRVTKQEFEFVGYLSGKTESKGGI